MDPAIETRMTQIKAMFGQGIPHCEALGMELGVVTPEFCTGSLPWDTHLVGNPANGVVHGGAVTTLIDSVAGMSVFAAMKDMAQVATLDLRVDYLRGAEKGARLHCRAECYKVTKKVAFVRATAYTTDIDDPVATANAAFMITRRGNMADKMRQSHEEASAGAGA